MLQPIINDDPNSLYPSTPANAPPFQILAGSSHVFLRQSIDWLQLVTNAVLQNELDYFCFDVSSLNNIPIQNQKEYMKQFENNSPPFLNVKEQSSFFARWCCFMPNRPLKLQFRGVSHAHVGQMINFPGGVAPGVAPLILAEGEKKCAWACLCFDRPEIKISMKTANNSYEIGTVRYNFSFFDFMFSILDAKREQIYEIDGSCCQCGLMCPRCVCDPCLKADFLVKDIKKSRNFYIKRKNNHRWKSCFARTDDFFIDLPNDVSLEDRVLLVCAGVMIDMMIYRLKEQQEGNN